MKVLQKLLMAVGVIALILAGLFITINVLNKIETDKVVKTIDSALSALKEYDIKKMVEYMVDVEPIEESAKDVTKTNKETPEALEAQKVLFKYLEYEITRPENMKMTDKEVLVDVKIVNKNIGTALVKYFTDSLTISFSNLFSTEKLSDEELEAKLLTAFVESVSSETTEMTASNITLKVVKDEAGDWKVEIIDEDKFMGAILPSLKETIANYIAEQEQ